MSEVINKKQENRAANFLDFLLVCLGFLLVCLGVLLEFAFYTSHRIEKSITEINMRPKNERTIQIPLSNLQEWLDDNKQKLIIDKFTKGNTAIIVYSEEKKCPRYIAEQKSLELRRQIEAHFKIGIMK